MADLALGVVKDVVKTGMAIKGAVETVHQNEKECQDLRVLVDIVTESLSPLHETGLTSRPMCLAAVRLHESLDRALKLVTKCQKRNGIHHFLTAGDMAKQLRRVQFDILMNMTLGNFTITESIFVELKRTTLPQGAWGMEIYSRHSTAGDAGIITTVTPGTEASFAPSRRDNKIGLIASSGLTEFSFSETVATHHVSEESISGGSGCTHVAMIKVLLNAAVLDATFLTVLASKCMRPPT